MKSRTMRWAGYVAGVGSGEMPNRLWFGKLAEVEHLQYLGVNERKYKNGSPEIESEVLRYIYLTKDTKNWRSFANTVMKLRVPENM